VPQWGPPAAAALLRWCYARLGWLDRLLVMLIPVCTPISQSSCKHNRSAIGCSSCAGCWKELPVFSQVGPTAGHEVVFSGYVCLPCHPPHSSVLDGVSRMCSFPGISPLPVGDVSLATLLQIATATAELSLSAVTCTAHRTCVAVRTVRTAQS
jgi:hypothetical protein